MSEETTLDKELEVRPIDMPHTWTLAGGDEKKFSTMVTAIAVMLAHAMPDVKTTDEQKKRMLTAVSEFASGLTLTVLRALNVTPEQLKEAMNKAAGAGQEQKTEEGDAEQG